MPQVGVRTRFTLVLSLVFVVAIVAAWLVFSQLLRQEAQDEITNQATVLLAMLNSVRSYTNTEVNPLLAPALKTQSSFIPQSVPAFSAREVFENFRKTPAYTNFLYKEATINPTDLRDLADPSEVAMVNQFRSDPSLTQLSGFTDRDGQQVLYIARPLSITSQNCLTCHSTPQNAPASLVATYGTEHGFGWTLNEIVAAQTIYVPAADVFAQAQQQLNLIMGIIIVLFAVVIIVTDAGLRRVVVRPVVQIARLAQLIASGTVTPESSEMATVSRIASRSDEFGHTAKVVQRMVREIYEREQKLQQQIQSLRIQIDTDRETKEVKEITDSDYFQNLQRRVQDIRQRGEARRVDAPPSDGDKPS